MTSFLVSNEYLNSYYSAAGEHIEKKPVDNIDWDTKTLVEGEIESGCNMGLA